jgi:hypothetical protein
MAIKSHAPSTASEGFGVVLTRTGYHPGYHKRVDRLLDHPPVEVEPFGGLATKSLRLE